MVAQDIVNQLHAENELMALLANVLASLLIPKHLVVLVVNI